MPSRSRYTEEAPTEATAAEGWTLERLAGPSGLYGANGIQFGPDGRLYVAQALGSQVSAIDTRTDAIETISAIGGPIVAPDDVAFDSRGDMYVTEVMSARVSARAADGSVRVIAEGVTAANGVTVYRDRIFMDEFRPGGRLFELFPDGRTPRLMASNLPLPNALAVGPDGRLYFPAVGDGEIWRIDLDGGRPERFVAGLAAPTAVKFDSRGFLVTPQALSGEITRIDLRSGTKTPLARVRVGIDNVALSPDGRLFVSHFTDGGVMEVLPQGSTRTLVSPGFVGPMGLCFGDDDTLYAADGLSIAAVSRDGACRRVAMLFDHEYPGYVRGLAAGANGWLTVANSAGTVTAYHRDSHEARVVATGLEEVYGLAFGPGGSLFAAEGGGGRLVEVTRGGEVEVRARDLGRPRGVAVAGDGTCYVSDAGGRVVRVADRAEVVLDGLADPQGIALGGAHLFVLEVGRRQLTALPVAGNERTVIARALPVGAPGGVTPKVLMGVEGLLPGPLSPFADLALGADGALYVGADGEGSILRLAAKDPRRRGERHLSGAGLWHPGRRRSRQRPRSGRAGTRTRPAHDSEGDRR